MSITTPTPHNKKNNEYVHPQKQTHFKRIFSVYFVSFVYFLLARAVRKDLTQRLQFRFFQNIHRKQATMIQWIARKVLSSLWRCALWSNFNANSNASLNQLNFVELISYAL